VIDGATNAVVNTISGLTQPWGVIVAGGKLYVGDAAKNSVRTVDLASGQITGEVKVGAAAGSGDRSGRQPALRY
jgi:DNA-binding beta-propeller fold protein YncE